MTKSSGLRRLIGAVTVSIAASSGAQAPPRTSEVRGSVTVTRLAEPKTLRFDVDVPASSEAVWLALSTTEGMKAWIAPDARVDLREGGEWLALFPGGAPGGGKILSFTRPNTIVIHAMAPETFPEVRAIGTTVTFALSRCGGQCTHVNLTQTGWLAGKQWDDAFDYLAHGNADLLEQLRRRFVAGPIDWTR
jgi:uncharacterized protein YndB with AHSA1/START domain